MHTETIFVTGTTPLYCEDNLGTIMVQSAQQFSLTFIHPLPQHVWTVICGHLQEFCTKLQRGYTKVQCQILTLGTHSSSMEHSITVYI